MLELSRTFSELMTLVSLAIDLKRELYGRGDELKWKSGYDSGKMHEMMRALEREGRFDPSFVSRDDEVKVRLWVGYI